MRHSAGNHRDIGTGPELSTAAELYGDMSSMEHCCTELHALLQGCMGACPTLSSQVQRRLSCRSPGESCFHPRCSFSTGHSSRLPQPALCPWWPHCSSLWTCQVSCLWGWIWARAQVCLQYQPQGSALSAILAPHPLEKQHREHV